MEVLQLVVEQVDWQLGETGLQRSREIDGLEPEKPGNETSASDMLGYTFF